MKKIRVYQELKKFSQSKVKFIIEKIQPKIILTEGISVYDELMSMFGGNDKKVLINDDKGKRILMSGKIGNSSIIGMIHPSGQFTRNQFQVYRNSIAPKVRSLISV